MAPQTKEMSKEFKYAIADNNVAKVKELIGAGHDPHAQNFFGEQAFQLACRMDAVETLKYLVEYDATLVAFNNDSVMWICKMEESIEILQVCLDHGMDVNMRDNNGDTPLHVASRYGTKDAVQFLIDNGAEVDAHNTKGETPLMQCLTGDGLQKLQTLLDNGADINAKDAQGHTALHHITSDLNIPSTSEVYLGKSEVMQTLLDKGADVHAKDAQGHTALYYAQNTQAIKALVKAGADPHAETKSLYEQYSEDFQEEIDQILSPKQEEGGIFSKISAWFLGSGVAHQDKKISDTLEDHLDQSPLVEGSTSRPDDGHTT